MLLWVEGEVRVKTKEGRVRGGHPYSQDAPTGSNAHRSDARFDARHVVPRGCCVGPVAAQKLASSYGEVRHGFAALDHHVAARQNHIRPGGDGHPFIRRIVGCVVQHRLADAHLAIGIPDDQVGIGADRDRPLAIRQPVEFWPHWSRSAQ